MNFFGNRIRAILLPLLVALLCIAGLGWYGLVRTPARQTYLNERNLRALRTRSAQIKAKIDNFDRAIDHALDSYSIKKGRLEHLREYVQLFAPELEILTAADRAKPSATPKSIEEQLLAAAGDPPRVAVQRDEGRSYLYLGSAPARGQGSDVTVVARSNLEALARGYLTTGTEFDALLLAGSDGTVFAQESPSGLTLARVDPLISTQRTASSEKAPDGATSFERFSMSSNVTDVVIGDAGYKLYVQPIQLSLLAVHTSNDGSPGMPEQWVLCGLVRADHFRAESAALSYPWLLLFSAALVLICLAIPIVKLRLLAPRERLRSGDAIWLSASTFLVAGLLTMGLMNVYVFRYEFRHVVQDRLTEIAGHVNASLATEVRAIWSEMEDLDGEAEAHNVVRKAIGADNPQIVIDSTRDQARGGRRLYCLPDAACASQIVATMSATRLTYPYFDMVVWNDSLGNQVVKWSAGPGVTPFINLKDESVPYFDQLEHGWSLPSTTQRGIDVLQSPNTGDRITVFWKALDKPAGDAGRRIGQSMTMDSPVTFDRPLLPAGVRFAVLDRDGRVLFHSDGTRSIDESFFQECEDDPDLRSAVLGRYETTIDAYYRGRAQQMFVTPLLLSDVEGDPGWSLAVFQDKAIADTVNLETTTIAAMLFLAYGAFLALLVWLLHTLWADRWTKWFWPVAGRQREFVLAAAVNASAAGVFMLAWLTSRNGSFLLWLAVALALGAAAATYVIVMRRHEHERGRANGSWLQFYMARTTFLFMLAAVPSMACFLTGYQFETRLLAASEQILLKSDRAARRDRIDARAVDKLELAHPNEFVDKRSGLQWDDDVPPFELTRAAAGVQSLDWAMKGMHRAYNDVAVQFRAAADNHEVSAAGLRGGSVSAVMLMSVVLLVALYALQRGFVHPIFMADIPVHVHRAPAQIGPSTRLLVIGPPGSGKSTRLAAQPNIRVFDIRTLDYSDRRKAPIKVPVERRRLLANVVGAFGGGGWRGASSSHDVEGTLAAQKATAPVETRGWAESFDYATLPSRGGCIGVDHLDHRIQEKEFRRQTLMFLEELVYRRDCAVAINSDRDPLECIAEGPDESCPSASELYRWARVLQPFRRERSGIGDDVELKRLQSFRETARASVTGRALLAEGRRAPQLLAIAEALAASPQSKTWSSPDEAQQEFGVAAEEYYRGLWSAASGVERLALRQLAEEGVVNPRNQDVVQRLMRWGVIVRGRGLKLMNVTFRRFVLQASTADEVARWERQGVRVPWGSIETAMITVVVGLAGLLIVTQEQLMGAWIGFVPTLAPAVPTAWKLLARGKHVGIAEALLDAE